MPTRRLFTKFSALALAVVLCAHGSGAKSCLWKITSESGILYLQGSVHVLKAGDYPLAPSIEQAYAESRELVFEVDMSAMISPKTQTMIMSRALLPDGTTLSTLLDPEIYRRLSDKCSDAGLPIASLEKFKPWFVAMTLTQMHMQSMGLDANLGLDKYFHDKAAKDGKPGIGLETVEFQIDLLDSLAEVNQDDFVRYGLKDLDLAEKRIDTLLKAWKEGDIETVGKLMNESFEEHPTLFNDFVVARNKDWADKITDMMKDSKTRMIVVGAAHLPGRQGLLELLRQKGCKLEQL